MSTEHEQPRSFFRPTQQPSKTVAENLSSISNTEGVAIEPGAPVTSSPVVSETVRRVNLFVILYVILAIVLVYGVYRVFFFPYKEYVFHFYSIRTGKPVAEKHYLPIISEEMEKKTIVKHDLGKRKAIETVAETTPVTEEVRIVVTELIAGPKSTEFQTLIPRTTRLKNIFLAEGGRLVLDFSKEFAMGLYTKEKARKALVSIEDTVFNNFPEINYIYITIEGAPVRVAEVVLLQEPIMRDTFYR